MFFDPAPPSPEECTRAIRECLRGDLRVPREVYRAHLYAAAVNSVAAAVVYHRAGSVGARESGKFDFCISRAPQSTPTPPPHRPRAAGVGGVGDGAIITPAARGAAKCLTRCSKLHLIQRPRLAKWHIVRGASISGSPLPPPPPTVTAANKNTPRLIVGGGGKGILTGPFSLSGDTRGLRGGVNTSARP